MVKKPDSCNSKDVDQTIENVCKDYYNEYKFNSNKVDKFVSLLGWMAISALISFFFFMPLSLVISNSFYVTLVFLILSLVFIVLAIIFYYKSEKFRLTNKEAIVYNDVRNQKIVDFANYFNETGRKTLILIKQIAHGKLLEEMIPGSIFVYGVKRVPLPPAKTTAFIFTSFSSQLLKPDNGLVDNGPYGL